MKGVKVPDAARAVKETARISELFEVFKDMPEPQCNICGRVIYCGVNSMCNENPCGLKRK